MGSIKRRAPVLVWILLTVSLANADDIPKDDWIDKMSTILPTAFCQPHQYFRQCFDVSQTECEETAMSAVRICLGKNKDKMPSVFVQPQDGRYWGRIVGSCAGGAYEITLRKKRISNRRCNDPNNWK
jgi:hypothetical protein